MRPRISKRHGFWLIEFGDWAAMRRTFADAIAAVEEHGRFWCGEFE